MAEPPQPRLPPLWLLAAAAWVGPYALHSIIPSIPNFAAEFGAGTGAAQAALTAYLVGIALGQLVYGPVSDRIGRRPSMLAGLALFTATTLGCALASSLEALVVLRLLQGAAGCAGQVLGRAIIRDCRPRDESASLLGYLTVMMALGSSFAPLAGGQIDAVFGWRANFAVLAAAAALFAVYAWRRLGETRPSMPLATGIGPAALLAGSVVLLRSRAFLGYALCAAFAQATWFGFISGAPHVLDTILGRPRNEYGLWILSCAAGYVVGNFCAGRYSVRVGGTRMMVVGLAISLVGAALQVALCAAGVLSGAALFLPMTVIVLAQGLFLPNANAGAVSVRPEFAGAASGLLGFMQMALGAVATLAMGAWLGASETPLIALTAGCSLAAALSLLLTRAAR